MILAGGEGTRLRPLTRLIAGDDRPKQFCAVLGDGTLLDRTWERARRSVDPFHTLVVVTRAHAPFYRPLLGRMPARNVVVQPGNRGTAAAIVYGLMRIAGAAPTGRVAILPSDHYVSDDAAFMRHVDAAFTAASLRPDLVVLLGVHPDRAETEYGWIEPGDRVLGLLRRVRRFWEKPDAALARTLLEQGCLWNSFVIVASVPALLALVRGARPALTEAFAALASPLGAAGEARVVEHLYRRLPAASFSDAVLARGAANLAVLPVAGVGWSDWGSPQRVLATLTRLGIAPAWAQEARAELA
jgi:mannose-1-phosphate guanylyltransferase